MTSNADDDVMDRVRRALGRGAAATAATPPPPPELPDSVVRLVGGDVDLAKLFAQRATEMKMIVTPVTSTSAAQELVRFIAAHPIRKVAFSVSPLLERLKLREALSTAGLSVATWDELTLDELYDYDCAVTDVDYAIAETASLVIKPDRAHGRALSLVPMYHIAFVEEKQLMPDLVDFFRELVLDPDRSNVILISGPSKTADIEMNVVTGVHGPNVVNAFLLRGDD
ncbi:MAG: L-lactate dehydrogenase complex protein LldG [Phycisphaerales bacterium]|jgi:L-lactate dehydrogenase complex protein LldG|nr:L-lactate dehydrogenase complex protein LldG [Phycisphaerales bacterium]